MPIEISEIINRAFSGKYLSHGSTDDGECVIGFSFGFQEKNNVVTPGISNEDLANFIGEHLHNKFLIHRWILNH